MLLTGKDKVQVPNVVGSPQAESEILLKRKGLSTDVTMKESPTQPKGTVIGQDPGGGSRVPKGSVVGLTVSAGPGTARVPDLAGKGRNEARKQLTDLGFNVAEERETSDTITENRVISTRPPFGQELDKGSQVVLVISSGKERVAVPKVVDLTEDEARSTLETLGFKVTVKEQETDDSAKVGQVLSQDPAASANRAKGSTVTVTVGKEPVEVDVPDVTGQGRLAATAALEQAGFEVDAVPTPTTDRAEDLHVISQDPADGKAKKGSTVTINYGQLEEATTTTPSSTEPGRHGDGWMRVAVLGGGRSSEHDVSLVSAATVGQGLRDAGHEVLAVELARDGTWWHEGEELALHPGRGLLDADVVFPVLHGPFGEDGTVQGLLELLDVPYVGSGVMASAVCMDKVVFKELMAQAGLPQVGYALVEAGRERPDAEHLGFPLWVKPARLGSSVGSCAWSVPRTSTRRWTRRSRTTTA